ncbi:MULTISPECIES: alpha/beta hydrolase [unclassified Diaminobutyricimonas]|uniref:alpha/beta fold hydrolase n=1 Tax=unclassified Diaminobutyricimonas TaxID=2643261 RepID=UPI00210428D4|nr:MULTISPECIES: alpha/beta hydrolase [unclassified Diaminobutyricimonas]
MNVKGVPVVFVHGIRVSGSMWRPVATIVSADRTVSMPDLPGHGSADDEPFTLDGAVATIRHAIDTVGGRALLVGHSLGGFIAMATLDRHPGQVAGFVGVGCSARPRGIGAALFRRIAQNAVKNPARTERMSERGFRMMLPKDVADAALAGGLSVQVLPEAIDVVSQVDPIEALSGFAGPVHLINGAFDLFRADERKLVKVSYDARLTILPRRNHISCLAETDTIATAVSEMAALLDARALDAY